MTPRGWRVSPDGRLYNRQGTSVRRRSKRGIQNQGLGRSRGGFSTKIHLRTNALGLPICAELTGGEVSDYVGFDKVMAVGGPAAKVIIAYRGYDSDKIRQNMEAQRTATVIPMRKNRKATVDVDSYIYAMRNRIERCFNKLKNFRRLAIRYDQSREIYLGFVQIAALHLWMRFHL